MAYRTEVIADNSGKWVGNALVFKTKVEASAYVADLFSRWMAVKQTRVVRTAAKVNYIWKDGRAFGVETSETVS